MTKVTLIPKRKEISVVIPIADLVEIKKPFYLTVEETWDRYCLLKLKKAGAPIKGGLLTVPTIEKGRVYRMELPEKEAIKVIWEDD